MGSCFILFSSVKHLKQVLGQHLYDSLLKVHIRVRCKEPLSESSSGSETVISAEQVYMRGWVLISCWTQSLQVQDLRLSSKQSQFI